MKKILLFVCALICSAAMSATTWNVTVPEGTKTCYIAGEATGWKHTEMTKVDATHYTITIETDKKDQYKYCSGPDWAWEEQTAEGDKVENRMYAEQDVVAKWKTVYDPGATVSYVDITIRVKAATAPTIWWWGAGDKCPNAENVPDMGYDFKTNQPVMTAVEGKEGWFEWNFKDVNETLGVTFKLNSGEKAINAKESTCYNTSGGIIDCNSDEPIGPIDPTEKVYVVTGGDASIFGAEWTENSACTLEKQDDGSYAWTKTDVTLAAGNIEYKMLEKGTWSGWQLPAEGNASFTIDKSGTYDLTFTLSADLSKQNVVTTLKEEVEVLPVVRLMGSLTNWGEGLVLTPSDDKLTASGVVSLEAKEYDMKIRVDGGWYGNAGTMDRGNCTGWVFDTTVESNAKITADVAGDYTFTWTYANKSLSVTYPMDGPTSISSTEAEVVTTKVIRDGQVLIIRDGVVYNMMGQAIR